MKKLLGVAAVAAASISMVASVPAHAAAYTIYGSSPITGIDTWSAFKAGNCDPALAKPAAAGGLGGIDSIFVQSGGRTVVNANWNATAKADDLVAALAAKFLTSNCQDVPTPFAVQSTKTGAWSFQVPAGTKWIVISARNTANVTITL